METYKMGAVESRFADLVWKHEPIGSGELVRLAGRELKPLETAALSAFDALPPIEIQVEDK